MALVDKKEEKEEEERVVRLELWARNTISRKGKKKKGEKGKCVCGFCLPFFLRFLFFACGKSVYFRVRERERETESNQPSQVFEMGCGRSCVRFPSAETTSHIHSSWRRRRRRRRETHSII